ncbi:hypothetical protein K503DRAFT_781046 [Rhizopogon vinicolor AM-OR11-026]|uniref:Uncharacterized protein n=1 Tax=Rhizopogon vinicolor AM-OR11-026 TaxID=1314800 RepID=A0A1B7N7X9_9AGAM|nr:hypothetical protein K503DRAFT_781046 [Rhizopogon vinicolor AM-OR11-026]
MGVDSPVIEGSAPELVPEEEGATTRHTPRPGTTLEPLVQLAEVQDSHVEDVVLKYWFWLQVARQRPLVRTGSALLQLVHWLKDPPEPVAQSGWQETQFQEELNMLEGQELSIPTPVLNPMEAARTCACQIILRRKKNTGGINWQRTFLATRRNQEDNQCTEPDRR